MNFYQKLDQVIIKSNSCLCVGLDSDYKKIPNFIKRKFSKQKAIFYFNKQIIDSTYDLVCGYKCNSAFYEAEGIDGYKALKLTVEYIRKKNPEILIIDDAKRGDIGNTNYGYVKSIFDDFKFDAVTINPYLGKEAIKPFLDKADKGIIILCRTSNSDAGEFQDLQSIHPKYGKMPLYQIIAKVVSNNWNILNNCFLVVGATYPKEISIIRQIAPKLPFLIPGVGSQGGDLEQAVTRGKNNFGRGIIINMSRDIIFCSSEKDFALKARLKAKQIKKIINKYRGG